MEKNKNQRPLHALGMDWSPFACGVPYSKDLSIRIYTLHVYNIVRAYSLY